MHRIPGVQSQRMNGSQPHEKEGDIQGEVLAFARGER